MENASDPLNMEKGGLEEAFPCLKGANPVAAAPTSGSGESNDTRDRRIANGKLYSSGVASWRTRVASTGPAEEHSSTARARVFVRVRPLFEHEAERGEWECVSTGERPGASLHEDSLPPSLVKSLDEPPSATPTLTLNLTPTR